MVRKTLGSRSGDGALECMAPICCPSFLGSGILVWWFQSHPDIMVNAAERSPPFDADKDVFHRDGDGASACDPRSATRRPPTQRGKKASPGGLSAADMGTTQITDLGNMCNLALGWVTRHFRIIRTCALRS